MSDAVHSPRNIPDRLDNPLRSAVFSWEALLVLVASRSSSSTAWRRPTS